METRAHPSDPSQTVTGPPRSMPDVTGDSYEKFVVAIRKLTGLDLGSYKPDQLQRRLPTVLGRLGIKSLPEYSAMLARDPDRLREFWDWVGIHVSEFFRDPLVYSFLEREVFPDIRTKRSLVRIWSAGCSIGCEPYSLAILLEEQGMGRPYRIQATDVSPDVLRLARSGGPYKPDALRGVSPARINRWFVAQQDGYFVRRELMTRVSFTTHDLLKDPFPSPLDLVSCRNVTIYFTTAVRDHVFARLAKSVSPGGVLLLGGSEVIGQPQELGLQRIAPSCYRKLSGAAPLRNTERRSYLNAQEKRP